MEEHLTCSKGKARTGVDISVELVRGSEGRADDALMEYRLINLVEAIRLEASLCRMDWTNRFQKMGYCLGIQDIMRRAYSQTVKAI
jgi:hypothetical protein